MEHELKRMRDNNAAFEGALKLANLYQDSIKWLLIGATTLLGLFILNFKKLHGEPLSYNDMLISFCTVQGMLSITLVVMIERFSVIQFSLLKSTSPRQNIAEYRRHECKIWNSIYNKVFVFIKKKLLFQIIFAVLYTTFLLLYFSLCLRFRV